VVRAIEEGEVENCNQARERYGIGGCDTVSGWVRKYGKDHLIGKVIRVETADERNEIKRLKQRVRVLEQTLADTSVDLALERAFNGLLGEQAGIEDMAAFKKKADGKLQR
jgi:transposase-like protein